MLVTFSLALFVSATLLFLVQPMFTRMVLPLLGGTPAVWNTCMVFYQAALLAGYAYAHAATQWLGVRRQAALHLALLGLVAFTLPIAIAPGWDPPVSGSPIPWLFAVLLLSVGLPFFVISTTAPMLQKWFAHTGHGASQDPYFLYGASNLGSMLALVGYPVVVEPYLRIKSQTWVWAGGYLALIGLIAACAVLLWRSPAETRGAQDMDRLDLPAVTDTDAPVGFSQRLWWVLLAFAPSSLLLGVTTYLSTDIAAVPLLWVIPLAIYLFTFVLVFSRRPLLTHSWMVFAEPYLVIPVAVILFLGIDVSMVFLLHLLTFFLLAMVCHGELMKYRPQAAHLTEFYLWMSVGGVLGGLFNALLAPVLFRSVLEYPLMIVIACMLRPYLAKPRPYGYLLDILLPLGLAAALTGVIKLLPQATLWEQGGLIVISCLGGTVCYSFRHRPLRFGLGVGAFLFIGFWITMDYQGQILYKTRNFFGAIQVRLDAEGGHHLLYHGTTLHGAQSLAPSRRRDPLTYFSRTGPLGQVFAEVSRAPAGRRVAVVGLGTGSIAAYGSPGQHFTFYEIDPAVEDIARNPHYFTFLKDSSARMEVVLGDARLSLKRAPPAGYDLIILDAFSSDAIPMHLVTREALDLYLSKLAPEGLLVFHISNRYLNLEPVMANLAADAGIVCLAQGPDRLTDQELKEKKCPSHWAVMARSVADLGNLPQDPRWRRLSPQGEVLWTDDFADILSVFNWRVFEWDKSLKSLFSAPDGVQSP